MAELRLERDRGRVAHRVGLVAPALLVVVLRRAAAAAAAGGSLVVVVLAASRRVGVVVPLARRGARWRPSLAGRESVAELEQAQTYGL